MINTSHVLVNNIFNTNFTNLFTFLKYFIICSLPEGDYWSFSIESTEFKFKGIFGLAPDIRTRNFTTSEERWVSACLFAHVNGLGKSIDISVRSAGVVNASEEEKNNYRTYEGAFFGSLANQHVYTCQGDDRQKALAESKDRQYRVCTDLNNECFMTPLGKCENICETFTVNYGWKNCKENGTIYQEVINVFLESDLKISFAPSQTIQSLSLYLLLLCLLALL